MSEFFANQWVAKFEVTNCASSFAMRVDYLARFASISPVVNVSAITAWMP